MAFPIRHLDSSTCPLILAKEPRQSDPSQVRTVGKRAREPLKTDKFRRLGAMFPLCLPFFQEQRVYSVPISFQNEVLSQILCGHFCCNRSLDGPQLCNGGQWNNADANSSGLCRCNRYVRQLEHLLPTTESDGSLWIDLLGSESHCFVQRLRDVSDLFDLQ